MLDDSLPLQGFRVVFLSLLKLFEVAKVKVSEETWTM